MFSPVPMVGRPEFRLMGLAPMAVSPPYRNKGAGCALVRTGLHRCAQLGFGAVVVLGHPAYYPRFGFQPADRFGICCEYEAPADAFMTLELQSR